MFRKKRYNSNQDNSFSRSKKTTNFNAERQCSSYCYRFYSENLIFNEFLCHLPMAIAALSFCILLFVFFDGVISSVINVVTKQDIYMNFFHMSHYIHILCASFASFYAFSENLLSYSLRKFLRSGVLAFLNSIFFCTCSDIILPSLSSYFFNQEINIHICFFAKYDMINIILFCLFGILSSCLLVIGNREYAFFVSKKIHIVHVWFGVLSALLYILSQVQVDIISNSGILYIFLFFSVVIPCILSDACVPYLITKIFSQNSAEYRDKKITY